MAENGPEFYTEPLEISIEDAGRRLVSPNVARRNMIMYAATDNELESLSFVNSLSVAFFSIGAFLFSWPITIWIELGLSEASKEMEVFFSRVAWSTFILSIISFGLGIYAICKRGKIIKTIKNESIIKGGE